MTRERLTSRARQSADDKAPYPGSINQEGRVENERGSMTYRTFEPSVENHEGQDLGDVHGNDERRNEMNIGIPDPASNTVITASEQGSDEADFQRKCLKASQCAELVLGEKVSDRVLLAQARDFLALDEEALDRTIERFNRTETLYAAKGEEKEEKEEKEEAPAEAAPAAPAPAAPVAPAVPEPVALPKAPEPAAPVPTVAAKEEPKKEEVKEEVKEEPKACHASKARALNLARLAARTLPVNECTRENIAKQTEKFASMNDEALALALIAAGEQPVVDDAAVAPAAPAPEKEKAAEAITEKQQCPVASVSESGFDLTEEFNDGPVASDAASDAELASVFADPMIDSMYAPQASISNDVTAAAEDLSGERKRAAKVGVKSVGGKVAAPQQPVVPTDDLGSLWKDAPDVNSLFQSV